MLANGLIVAARLKEIMNKLQGFKWTWRLLVEWKRMKEWKQHPEWQHGFYPR